MIGVVIGTYGDRSEWGPLAERAAASVRAQMPTPATTAACIWSHKADLATARNDGAYDLITGPGARKLIFLDADDELDPGYVAAMVRAASEWPSQIGAGAIFRPNTIGVYPDGTTDDAPCMIPRTDMTKRNCCVIGTMVPAGLFQKVGGFKPYPHLEDWALFRAMLAAGASLVDVPGAVYRVHVRDRSRNAPSSEMNETYRRIRKEIPL